MADPVCAPVLDPAKAVTVSTTNRTKPDCNQVAAIGERVNQLTSQLPAGATIEMNLELVTDLRRAQPGRTASYLFGRFDYQPADAKKPSSHYFQMDYDPKIPRGNAQ